MYRKVEVVRHVNQEESTVLFTGYFHPESWMLYGGEIIGIVEDAQGYPHRIGRDRIRFLQPPVEVDQ